MTKGMTPFEPTQEQREQVETLAGFGLEHDKICLLIKNHRTGKAISPKTLRKCFRDELDVGMSKTYWQVAQSLYHKALGKGPQSVTACIFWLKAQGHWRDTYNHELSGKDGGPIPLIISKREENF